MLVLRRTVVAAALAALLAAPAVRAVDTPAYSQWLVTSAKATGATGELFVTSLRIVNPGAVPAGVDLFYYPRVNFDQGTNSAPGDNSAAAKKSVVVPPGQTLQIDDVLATLFGETGPSDSGGLRIDSDNAVSVLSQTLVTNAKSSTGVPGTNGFAIPAQLIENAVAAGDTAYVPYLSSAPDLTAGYRSNLFLLSGNASSDTVVTVKLVNGSDGTTAGTRDVTLGKLVQTQINNIGKVYGFTANFTNLTAVLTVKSGGPVFTGASIIDNAISSQIYAPPTKRWLPEQLGVRPDPQRRLRLRRPPRHRERPPRLPLRDDGPRELPRDPRPDESDLPPAGRLVHPVQQHGLHEERGRHLLDGGTVERRRLDGDDPAERRRDRRRELHLHAGGRRELLGRLGHPGRSSVPASSG